MNFSYLFPILGILFHEEVSVNQVASLMRGKRNGDFLSRPVEFVNSNKDARITFKKVPCPTGETFTALGGGGYFEIQPNSVMRHNLRMNGRSLTLAETSSLYDFVGSEESSKLYEIYNRALDKIPSSEAVSSLTGQPYPNLILCSNKQVLRIRKKKKILTYPR